MRSDDPTLLRLEGATSSRNEIEIRIEGESSLSANDWDYLKHIMLGVEGNGS